MLIYNLKPRGEKMVHSIPKRWHIHGSMYDAYTVECIKMADTHWHSHYLLNLFIKGEGVQVINGKDYPIHKGSMIIISPLDFHRNIIAENDVVSARAVKFSDKLFYDSLGDICAIDDFPIVTTLSEDDFKTAEKLFSMLFAEQNNKDRFGSDKFAQSIIEQLVILAFRADKRAEKEKSATRMHRALVYTQYNFRQNIKVGDVAHHIGYSPNYFSSEFKKETGVEFQKYLCDLRLDFAMNLLKLSKLSVTEACFESGFNTLPHFSQAFKKKFGTTPEKVKETCNG